MSEQDYKYFTRLLLDRKQAIMDSRAKEGIGRHLSLKESTQELSAVDNHPGDLGSELFERSKDLSLHDKNLQELKEIDEALERISTGDYGLCLRCKEPIPLERLKTLPETLYCLCCKKFYEKEINRESLENRRPVEELPLYPPFVRGDDLRGGDETWQEVARFGTASSTKDEEGEDLQ